MNTTYPPATPQSMAAPSPLPPKPKGLRDYLRDLWAAIKRPNELDLMDRIELDLFRKQESAAIGRLALVNQELESIKARLPKVTSENDNLMESMRSWMEERDEAIARADSLHLQVGEAKASEEAMGQDLEKTQSELDEAVHEAAMSKRDKELVIKDLTKAMNEIEHWKEGLRVIDRHIEKLWAK